MRFVELGVCLYEANSPISHRFVSKHAFTRPWVAEKTLSAWVLSVLSVVQSVWV